MLLLVESVFLDVNESLGLVVFTRFFIAKPRSYIRSGESLDEDELGARYQVEAFVATGPYSLCLEDFIVPDNLGTG